MKGVFLSLTAFLCLQCSRSMPFPPDMDNNVPELPESEEDRQVLGQLVEDVDVLKSKDEAQDHQIDILQKDVHGIAHTMEEQSLLLDKITNIMEHEGLVLEDGQPGFNENHDKSHLPPVHEVPHFHGMNPWDEEKEPPFGHYEGLVDEDGPMPYLDIDDSMYDSSESYEYY